MVWPMSRPAIASAMRSRTRGRACSRVVRRAARQRRPSRASSGDRNAVESSSSMPFSCITSATAAISASVFFERAARQITESSVRSGMKSEKIFTCLTWPAITASVTPPSLSSGCTLPELAERHPVQRRAARRGGGDELRLGLVLDRDDGDVVALARARRRAPGTETGRCRRSGRCRLVRRLQAQRYSRRATARAFVGPAARDTSGATQDHAALATCRMKSTR